MFHNNEFVLVVAGVSLWYYMHHRARVAPKETYVNKALIEDAGGSNRPDMWNRTWWKTSEAPSSNNPAVNPHKAPLPDGNKVDDTSDEPDGNKVDDTSDEPIHTAYDDETPDGFSENIQVQIQWPEGFGVNPGSQYQPPAYSGGKGGGGRGIGATAGTNTSYTGSGRGSGGKGTISLWQPWMPGAPGGAGATVEDYINRGWM